MTTLITFVRERNWLTATALWTIALSWAAAGVWGWSQTSSGIIAPVLMALTLGAQIAGARMVAIAASATRARRVALVALAIGCVCWSGYAGKRAIETSEAQRLAPAAAYAAAVARADAAAAAVAAVPAVALQDAAGRPIGPQRLAILQEARASEIARLAAERDAAVAAIPVAPVASATPMPQWLMWAVAGLVEMLELLGFWAIGAGHARKAATVTPINPAAELARKRWNKV
jgi:hypothetical protein